MHSRIPTNSSHLTTAVRVENEARLLKKCFVSGTDHRLLPGGYRSCANTAKYLYPQSNNDLIGCTTLKEDGGGERCVEVFDGVW
jgi:hypothetical protein